MELHFRNRTSSALWVAIMFYDPESCGRFGNWGTRGWWPISPGGEAYVLNTGNPYAAFYAESASNDAWSGPYGPVHVRPQAFDSCISIRDNNPHTLIVGMQLVHLSSDVYYANLVQRD